MNVNKNSWHYQFIAASPFNPAQNICKYFWQPPAILAVYFIIIFFIIVIIIFTLAPWLSLAVAWYTGDPILWLLGISKVSLMLQFLAVAFFGGCYLWDKYWEWRADQPISIAPPKPPGIIKTYYRAWKAKYCPTLEFIYIKND